MLLDDLRLEAHVKNAKLPPGLSDLQLCNLQTDLSRSGVVSCLTGARIFIDRNDTLMVIVQRLGLVSFDENLSELPVNGQKVAMLDAPETAQQPPAQRVPYLLKLSFSGV